MGNYKNSLLIIFSIQLQFVRTKANNYECGKNGRFEYCVDNFPGCVIGCHCHPGFYFDSDTKICEPNSKLIVDYKKHYEVQPTRNPHHFLFTPTPSTTFAYNEHINAMTNDTDDLGEWLYNQFFKAIENQVISNTSSDTNNNNTLTRRSNGRQSGKLKKKSKTNKRADKSTLKRKSNLRRKLLKITENDSLFDIDDSRSSKSDSSSSENSDSSPEDDHDHRKIIAVNKKKPRLPSFIFLPNMETPFYPPIGLPAPPPIPMYPMVPIPPVPIWGFEGNHNNNTATTEQSKETQAPTTTTQKIETTTTVVEQSTIATTVETATVAEEEKTTPIDQNKMLRFMAGRGKSSRNQRQRNKMLHRLRAQNRMRQEMMNNEHAVNELLRQKELNLGPSPPDLYHGEDDFVPNPNLEESPYYVSMHQGNPQFASYNMPLHHPAVQQLPIRQQPIRQPPIRQPHMQQPPMQQPPIQQPPIQQPPIQQPPIQQPPIQQPPMQQPPIQQPPIRQQPIRQQPIRQQHLLQPPIQQPILNNDDEEPMVNDANFQYISQLIHKSQPNSNLKLNSPNNLLPPIETRRGFLTAEHPVGASNPTRYTKIHKTPDDLYYEKLGREIASLIQQVDTQTDKAVFLEASPYKLSPQPVFNGNSYRSYWERSVRSPYSIRKALVNSLKQLGNSNEELFNLENIAEVVATTVPNLSLQQIENLIQSEKKLRSDIQPRNNEPRLFRDQGKFNLLSVKLLKNNPYRNEVQVTDMKLGEKITSQYFDYDEDSINEKGIRKINKITNVINDYNGRLNNGPKIGIIKIKSNIDMCDVNVCQNMTRSSPYNEKEDALKLPIYIGKTVYRQPYQKSLQQEYKRPQNPRHPNNIIYDLKPYKSYKKPSVFHNDIQDFDYIDFF